MRERDSVAWRFFSLSPCLVRRGGRRGCTAAPASPTKARARVWPGRRGGRAWRPTRTTPFGTPRPPPRLHHAAAKPGKHCSNVCFSCLLPECSLSLDSVAVQMKVERQTWHCGESEGGPGRRRERPHARPAAAPTAPRTMIDWDAALFFSWEPGGGRAGGGGVQRLRAPRPGEPSAAAAAPRPASHLPDPSRPPTHRTRPS
jgi:hypothetical protein